MTAHASILEQWLARAADVYGEKIAQRTTTERDPFRNPIGHALRVHLSVLVSELLGAMDASAIAAAFENVIALRAIQDLSVEQALGFVPALRSIVRGELPDADFAEMDARIDRLSLSAVAQYLRCRERLWELRLNERLRALGPEPYRLRSVHPSAPACPDRRP